VFSQHSRRKHEIFTHHDEWITVNFLSLLKQPTEFRWVSLK